MNLWQRIQIIIRGAAYLGHRTRPGWKGSLPFYAFRCPVHGIVENYTQGYSKILECPICQEEERENGSISED